MNIEDYLSNLEGDDSDHTELNRLIERINQLSPMANHEYRDEEAKIRFLREPTIGTE